jgi:hypothetical protein
MRRFLQTASAALVKADSMKHTFKNESSLNVRQYITEKQSLYLEAEESNVDNIVRRIPDVNGGT